MTVEHVTSIWGGLRETSMILILVVSLCTDQGIPIIDSGGMSLHPQRSSWLSMDTVTGASFGPLEYELSAYSGLFGSTKF